MVPDGDTQGKQEEDGGQWLPRESKPAFGRRPAQDEEGTSQAGCQWTQPEAEGGPKKSPDQDPHEEDSEKAPPNGPESEQFPMGPDESGGQEVDAPLPEEVGNESMQPVPDAGGVRQ